MTFQMEHEKATTSRASETADDFFEKAHSLLQKNSPRPQIEAIALLQRRVDNYPADARNWYELASALDTLGFEHKALPPYERAYNLGYQMLPRLDQPRLFVQLGSTLRNVKKYRESRAILREGMELFPTIRALKAFGALTEYVLGNYQASALLFLESSLPSADDWNEKDYSRALRAYFEKIR